MFSVLWSGWKLFGALSGNLTTSHSVVWHYPKTPHLVPNMKEVGDSLPHLWSGCFAQAEQRLWGVRVEFLWVLTYVGGRFC